MKNKIIKSVYDYACMNYINAFCKKHKLIFYGWKDDNVGGFANLDCILPIKFEVIKHDIDNNVPSGVFYEWICESIDNSQPVSYLKYTMGLKFEKMKY
jgi:hypothetical protein